MKTKKREREVRRIETAVARGAAAVDLVRRGGVRRDRGILGVWSRTARAVPVRRYHAAVQSSGLQPAAGRVAARGCARC